MASTAPPTTPERKVSADEAREVAEAAREQQWAAPSFVRDLFLGSLRMALIDPYPERDPDEVTRAQPFLDKLERFLRDNVDSDRIDREGEIPDAVIQGLRELGAFGIDRKSTRLNSSHLVISYAVFCLKKKKKNSQPFGLLRGCGDCS